MISWLIDTALWLLSFVWSIAFNFAKERPYAAALIVWGIVRSFGTVVQSGHAGVLFRFGRAVKVLEPGFHPLMPIFHAVRKLPIRSITLDLPRQRITSATGLVFDADTSIVIRVEDPIKAVTLVTNLAKAIKAVVPLIVHDLLREHDFTDRQAIDAELTRRARVRLECWGLTVEQAGLSSIAPTKHTTRLTQLRQRVMERRRLLEFAEQGLPLEVAVLLSCAGPAPLGHSAHRYRRHRAFRLFKQRLDHLQHTLRHLEQVYGPETAIVLTGQEGEAKPSA